MGISLNVSNALQPLSVRLSEDLKSQTGDPFAPQWVVTQTEGMNSWLRIELANRLGIAANIRFCKPNDIISRIHQWCDPAGKTDLDEETTRWNLYTILGSDTFAGLFPEIKAYYGDNNIKRIALADELADLYDQYQVYRFEHIGEWNSSLLQGQASADWQGWLWQQLKSQTGGGHHDRVEMSDHILQALQDPEMQSLVRKRIGQLHFFGIAVITPYYLRLLHALSQCIDIHLYLINPAPGQHWMEDRSERQISALLQRRNIQRKNNIILQGNDLLLNWGRIIKETFGLLLQHDDFINRYDDSFAQPHHEPKTLLHRIQHDIYHNAIGDARQPIRLEDTADGSLVINGCFTPLREVEVLYNHLVKLVDESQGRFSARDILVMVNDIDLYAPYIHAVFRNAPYRFPFTIADETITADNNLFTAIRQILSLDPATFKAEAVLELLESPYVRNRFQIRDVAAMRTAVRQAGIVFSMDGREADATRQISWNHGLKRMLYGICMGGTPDYDDGRETVVPLDTDEGASAFERVRLIHFIQVLQERIREWDTPRTIAGWAEYLNGLVEDLVFASGEMEDEDYPKFVQMTEQMALLEAAHTDKVSFEVFRHSFLHRLSREKRSQSFAGAGITFCSLIPMRSIPFRVVAMLGMDNDKFPRKETPLSFSLLTQQRLPGDRNIKDNDRHLFLETLLSAKEHLYISHIARSARDAADLPPSSLVDELIDYVARRIPMDTDELRRHWVKIHPLQGFSRRYGSEGLVTYLNEDRFATGIQVPLATPEPPVFSFDTIDVEALSKFMQNPSKTYINKVLNVYFWEEDTLLPDHEPFEIDSFPQHQLKAAMVRKVQAVPEAEWIREQPTGTMPLHNLGLASVNLLQQSIDPYRTVFMEAVQGAEAREVEVRLPIAGSTLTGRIAEVNGNRYCCVCTSGDRLKYAVPYFVKYLALVAQGEIMDFVFIGRNITKKDSIEQVSIPAGAITQAEALDILESYVTFYKQGHQDYFPFFPALGNKDFDMIKGAWQAFQEDYEEALENEYNYTFSDEYITMAIGHGLFSEALYETLKANVHAVLDPLHQKLPLIFKPEKK